MHSIVGMKRHTGYIRVKRANGIKDEKKKIPQKTRAKQ